MSKVLEVLDDAMMMCFWRDGMKHLGPGQVVMKLSPEKREILSKLTSEEAQSLRPDLIYGYQKPKRKGRWGL